MVNSYRKKCLCCNKSKLNKIIDNDKSGLVIKTGQDAVRLLHTEPDLKISRGVSI